MGSDKFAFGPPKWPRRGDKPTVNTESSTPTIQANHGVFDKRKRDVKADSYDLDAIGYAKDADEAKWQVHDAMRRSGTRGPKPKQMVMDTHPSGKPGWFIHNSEKTWYD